MTVATYHNHSRFSDGKATLREVVERAIELEIDELGISDHLTLHPTARVPWSMPPDAVQRYVDAVHDEAQSASGRINLRLGLELDWFDNRYEVLKRLIESQPFDYIVGSVHFVGQFAVDGNPHRWKTLSQDDVDRLHRDYWVQVTKMAQSGLFDVAAHLDLPKKFGHLPREQPWELIEPALDALAAADMIVELNTAGWHKPCADAYPSLAILEMCRQRGIATVISADAHDPNHLLRDFDRAEERLREAGYAEVVRFGAEGSRSSEPIGEHSAR